MRGHVARKEHPRGSKSYRWYPVVELPRDPKTGRRRQKWHPGHATRRAAQRALTEILGQLHSGLYVEPSRRSVAELLDEWLAAREQAGKLRANSVATYRRYAGAYVIPRIGRLRLQQVDASTITRLLADLAADGRRDGRGGLGPKSVGHVRTLIGAAFAYALKRGYVPRNPVTLVDAPHVPKRRQQVWTAAELRAFLAFVAGDRLAALWLLDATSGLRRSELLGLAWDALDLDAGRLEVVRALVMVGRTPRLVDLTKTAAGRRQLALDPATVAALKAHRKAQLAERLAWGEAWTDIGLVFTREDGAWLHPESVSKRFGRLVTRAGLPRIRLHDVRHSYATAAIDAGVPLKVISERLGHASVTITADLYQHVTPATDQAAADTIAGLILGAPGGLG